MGVYNKFYTEEEWGAVNSQNKEIMNDFLLEYKSQKKKPSTLFQYQHDIQIVLIYILKKCNNKSILELSKKDFRNFSLWFSEEKNVSNARVNRLMSSCRSLLNYVENEDDYEYEINQAAKVKGLPKETVRDIVFIEDDVIMMLYEDFMNTKRFKEASLLMLLYESGARKGEVAQVEKECFIQNKDCTNIVIGKRGKKFSLLIFDKSKKAVKEYLKERGEDSNPALFLTENKATARKENLYDWVVGWRKDIKRLTNKDYEINVHSLRHSCLQNMSDGTHYVCREKKLGSIPLEKLMLVANHNDVSTTQGYLKDNSREELENLFGIKMD